MIPDSARPPGFPSTVEIVDTEDGASYRFYYSKGAKPPLPLFLGIIAATRVASAGLAVFFVSQRVQQIPWWLLALSCLFVLQMFYMAGLPWGLFRRMAWQRLAADFGYSELRLRDNRLLLGSRAGPFRVSQRRDIQEFRGLVVYSFLPENPASPSAEPTGPSAPAVADAECVVLAVECEETAPWHLVGGYSRAETLALAEDLHRRLTAAAGSLMPRKSLAPIAVIETDQATLYPPLDPDFYRRRQPVWLAWHLAGTIGLGALTKIAFHTGAWQSREVCLLLCAGWILEAIVLTFTIVLPRTRH